MKPFSSLKRCKRVLGCLLAAGVVLACAFGAGPSQAATDDVEFDECVQALAQRPDALTADAWHKPPLDTKIAQFVQPLLDGDVVIRWISHKNQNGAVTISILTRDPEPQPEDDPDGFYVILEQGSHLSLKADVGAHGFSFSKEINKGINGIFFCTRGDVFKIWMWNGNNWEISK